MAKGSSSSDKHLAYHLYSTLGESLSLNHDEGNDVRIYVGNISREVTDDDLRGAFAAFGQVESAMVLKDKFTGESRGFGFVEMLSGPEAKAAINGMNGKDLKGRTLNVNEARPREDNRGGGGGFGGGGFGGGGRSSGPRRSSGGGGGRQRY
jgi:RNA recognition motif-containing protein